MRLRTDLQQIVLENHLLSRGIFCIQFRKCTYTKDKFDQNITKLQVQLLPCADGVASLTHECFLALGCQTRLTLDVSVLPVDWEQLCLLTFRWNLMETGPGLPRCCLVLSFTLVSASCSRWYVHSDASRRSVSMHSDSRSNGSKPPHEQCTNSPASAAGIYTNLLLLVFQ